MIKTRKTPLRMCIGCREMKPKKELIRVVKNNQDEISLDTTGKKPGRGAYMCKTMQCMEKVIKVKALNKEFKINVDVEVYKQLKEEMEAFDGG